MGTETIETFALFGHVLAAIAIIALVLLQQGKGSDMGASFGAGASQTLFGSTGAATFFSRLTAIMATVFFLTSFGLALLARDKADFQTEDVLLPQLIEQKADQEVLPVIDDVINTDLPQVVEKSAAAEVSDLPETETAPVE